MQRLLTVPKVVERTSLSRSTLYRLIERREFPQPVKVGMRRIAWPEDEVEVWMALRLAQRANA